MKTEVAIPFLQTFKQLKPGDKQILIQHLDKESSALLCEAVANALYNEKVWPPSKAARERVRKAVGPHEDNLRAVSGSSRVSGKGQGGGGRVSKRESIQALRSSSPEALSALVGQAVNFLVDQAMTRRDK